MMTKNLTKILVLFAGFILTVLFFIGIIGSIQLNNLLEQKVQIQQESEHIVIDYDFTQNPDYQDAFRRQEGNYGNEEDVIYK
ncbi:MAG: hypothetical protein PHR96_01750 [Clostridia bacterium]|nr:hypothetical protein [Clostridia bacterium]